MEAWLITWGWMSDHAATEDKIVTVLSPTRTRHEVADIVQILYTQFTSTVGELAHYAADPSAVPYKSEISETAPGYYRITCGHHPWLEARLVRDLSVVSGEDASEEIVTWEEQTASGEWKRERYKSTKG
jgi:hypothetical protein